MIPQTYSFLFTCLSSCLVPRFRLSFFLTSLSSQCSGTVGLSVWVVFRLAMVHYSSVRQLSPTITGYNLPTLTEDSRLQFIASSPCPFVSVVTLWQDQWVSHRCYSYCTVCSGRTQAGPLQYKFSCLFCFSSESAPILQWCRLHCTQSTECIVRYKVQYCIYMLSSAVNLSGTNQQCNADILLCEKQLTYHVSTYIWAFSKL